MLIYVQVIENVQKERKNEMAGQMSLLDFLSDEDKKSFEITYPDVEDYSNEQKLAMEKEVLGIYASGHPLDEYREVLGKNATASTTDFLIDEETGHAKAKDQVPYILGGMVAGKTVKLTKNNQNMAFITLEDLRGTVEVIVFPRDYALYQNYLKEDDKVFIRGRASISEEEGKLICEQVVPFDQVPKEIWVQFEDKEAYFKESEHFMQILKEHKGTNPVVVFCRKEKAIKRLSPSYSVKDDDQFLEVLHAHYGFGNVKVIDKAIDNFRKMH